MKVKYTALMADARGKLNGTVASKNRGGAYFRTKVTPVNQETPSQVAARNRLTAFAQGWRSLTDAQRTAWNNAVSSFTQTDIFGDVKTPSGINLYTKLNSNLSESNNASITTPPLPSAVTAATAVGGTADAGDQSFEVTFAPSPVPAGMTLIIKATKQVSPGVKFVKGKYVTIAVAAAASASPQDIASAYIAKFGALVTGQKIGISVHFVKNSSGQSSLPLSTLITVQA